MLQSVLSNDTFSTRCFLLHPKYFEKGSEDGCLTQGTRLETQIEIISKSPFQLPRDEFLSIFVAIDLFLIHKSKYKRDNETRMQLDTDEVARSNKSRRGFIVV